ncbi:GNAT family N-acetyltransferase [Dethiosulfovibrio salsuginis]|uniref:Acetyltransferase (GNAT) domain-containing protein n=1 Tax=Dethiosulfovibrio salsuginis TaxID=561720 RepID=A0A1X7KYZ0_9BACT|nr:GNAT family N-acetyltransferase [Dethiosulfovibrio salsuginis]SMG46650.1 Acetyltransferase (GNAT) domain-containing protein [Dethiosulfovibrio salsuginis]
MKESLCRVVPFNKEIDRTVFSCGIEELDRYIKKQVSQDIKRNLTKCHMAVNSDNDLIGYYTLSAFSVPLRSLPEDRAKKYPYPLLPAVLLGRLAVDQSMQGKGLGGFLLQDGLLRILTLDIGVFAVFVEAKDETAKRFYGKYGFESIPQNDLHLFLPMDTVKSCLI